MEGGGAAEEGPALWVGVTALGAGRAETNGPAGEELPDSPLELPKGAGASEVRGSLFLEPHVVCTTWCREDSEIERETPFQR